MGIEVILRIAGVGILTAIINSILKKTGKEEIATVVTIAGLVISLVLIMDMIGGLVDTIKDIFRF